MGFILVAISLIIAGVLLVVGITLLGAIGHDKRKAERKMGKREHRRAMARLEYNSQVGSTPQCSADRNNVLTANKQWEEQQEKQREEQRRQWEEQERLEEVGVDVTKEFEGLPIRRSK